jgi:type VI secretion system protein ImpA
MLTAQAMLSTAPGLAEKEKAALVAQHEARVNRVKAATRAHATEQPEAMAELIAAIARSREALTTLEAAIDARVAENGIGVKFEKLAAFLARVAQTLAAAQDSAAPGAGASAEEAAMTSDSALNGAAHSAVSTAPAATGAIPGRVNSRRDVEICLDMIIDFYERTEPSSPIPHLARRMRKMVPMNFMQLMDEIAPSGMKEFRNVAGVTDDKPK